MSDHYDAIIIGAGLGGLSVSTMLARNGMRVLLLERHNIPGGYATSFVRGRFEFEIALHELSGIGPNNKGDTYRFLDYLGVAEKVEFIRVENMYRSVFPDFEITVPPGFEAYEAKLIETFPKEADGIHKFLKRLWDFAAEFTKVAQLKQQPSPLQLMLRYPKVFRYMPVTFSQVLDRDVKDPYARAVISQYWGYFGMPPSEITFLYFALGLHSYVKHGPSHIKGRSQALSNAFVQRLEELGGEVRFNCGVKTITTDNGRVNGVITDQEEAFKADWVISNADPVTTCADMIGKENVPSSFFRKLQSSKVAASTVNVYMGVNKSVEDLGLSEHENFYNPDPDIQRHYEMTKHITEPPMALLTPYNTIYPDISPPGTSMIVLTCLAYGDPWIKLAPDEYVDTKNRVADAMIEVGEKMAPGLRVNTEVVEVATPLTNMRYAGALGGSIYGFDQPPHDSPAWRMAHKGPLDGLYFVGAWTRPGGGFGPAMLSGQMAGAQILKQVKKAKAEA